MVKLIIQPTQGCFVAKHPVTGEEYFEKEDGSMIQGIFTVVGTSSKEFYNYINTHNQFGVLTTGNEDTTAEMLASLIVDWEDNGFISDPYSPEVALEMLEAPENLWLRSQLKLFMEDTANFFGNEVKA